ncbi:DUF4352 domain-containing protein [Rhodococcus sp. HM1]|nr:MULTISPECIES: DUF4352 domain-containing protein [unclassified Rhodococcus (in: high G+C Gram-positive bacteria)]MCK8672649.1 DUF4352 domain-containing protein [Rhodococcus sp. HM1]
MTEVATPNSPHVAPYVNKVPQGQSVFVHVDVTNIGDKATNAHSG